MIVCKQHIRLTKQAGSLAVLTNGRAYKCEECGQLVVVDLKPLEIKVSKPRLEGKMVVR